MKSNIEHLRALLTTDEQSEFLDAIESEIGELKSDVDYYKDEADFYKRELSETKDQLEKATSNFTTITTPIGFIEYRVTGSMDLQTRMEQLANELYSKYTQTIAI